VKILEINNLTKRYGNIQAIKDLNLVINQGEIYGLLGPNGSGKTATLSIILDVIESDNGDYFWFGEKSDNKTHRRIGTLIETPNFYPYLSCEQNLRIVAEIKFVDPSDVDRVLKLVKLYDRRRSKFKQLSLGMKQRLALASVLIGDPEVLVLDEPANGLDPEGIAEVREIIKSEAKKNKTVILASHILDEVEKVCTHVGVLKNGLLLSSGRVNELLNSEDEVIISTERLSEFGAILKNSPMLKSIIIGDEEITLILNKEFSSADINKYASKNGFDLTRLEIRKKTLEDQFLELVK